MTVALEKGLQEDSPDDESPIETPASKGQIPLTLQSSNAESIWLADTMSKPREVLFLFVIYMAQACTQAAFCGTLFLLRTIGPSFNVDDPPHLAWLVGGYSLTVGTFILFSGRLGDIFGYKRMLIIGFIWFSVWSAISGISVYSNFKLAVVSRVLQGIGPAICLPNALAILGSIYPPGHRKAMVFAMFGAVAPIGAVCGAVVATLLAKVWWPWAQWVMAMYLLVMAVLSVFIIPDQAHAPTPSGNLKFWSETLDLPGAVAGMLSLVLFNFAWTQSPIDGWNTPAVLVPLILGLLIFVAFGYIEAKVSTNPLVPFSALNTDVILVLAAVACGWATFGVWTLYLVQILEDIRNLSPLLGTAWMSPVVISGSCAAVFTGKLLGPWQVRPAVVMTMALVAFTIGVTLTATAPYDQIYWGQTFVAILIMPFGMDMSFPASTLILSNSVPKKHQGVGASLVNTVVNYGIALGVAFAGTVEIHVRGSEDTLEGRLQGYRGALYIGIGLAGLGVGVCALFLFRVFVLRRSSST